MSSSIILPSEFDISKLTYGDVRKLDNSNGQMVSVGYAGHPLVIQTCECYAPFGLSCYQNDDGKAPSYALNLSFKNMDSRKNLKKLYEMYNTIDQKNIEMGMDNSVSWLKQKKAVKSTEIVEALYTPMIITPKDDKYPSTFKFKIPMKNGRLACDVYDKNHELMDLLSIDINRTKGAKCTAILQCTGIWLAGGKFGMSWKCVQLKVCPQENFSGFCMKNVPDDSIVGDDIDEEDALTQKPQRARGGSSPQLVASKEDSDDQDDDDEDGSDEDDDETPVPVITRKK